MVSRRFKLVRMAKYGNSHARVLAASTLTLVDSVTDTEAGTYGIRSVDFSPDGTKIVSGADSGMIKVWDGERRFKPSPAPSMVTHMRVCTQLLPSLWSIQQVPPTRFTPSSSLLMEPR